MSARDTEFRRVLDAAGLAPVEIITDGALHRCPTANKPNGKDGAYIAHADSPESLWWKNWRTGQSDTWTAKGASKMNPAERAAFKQRVEQDRAAREDATAALHAEKAALTQRIYESAPACPADHPYLVKKGVPSLGGLRLARDGRIIVPVLGDDGKPQSLQFIAEDGEKRFLTGGKMAGGFFAIKAPGDKAGPLYIAEGYATGASIHMATGTAVLCAFTAGNLLAVAEMARTRYPDQEIILCADDDLTEGNPGLTKATDAARAVNAKLAVPVFRDHAGRSDFNDMAMEQGLDAVRAALDQAKAPDPGGHLDGPNQSIAASGPSEPESAPWKLARELFPRVPFPWEVLPPVIGASLKQLARACATSATPLPGQALCLVAAALGRKLDVLAKASWREPLVFWSCDIRDSGAGKTSPMWELARELTRRQANEHERFKAEQDEWGKTSPQDRQGMTQPRNPRGYFTTNLTLEGVHTDLDSHHTGGLAVLLSELSALISGQNQYKKGGTDREGWLCLHDGKPARVTRARGSVFIQGARVQVCGGIQPGIFRQVFGGDGGQYIEDGTVFRCLFTFEPSMHHELTAESWTDEHRETWAATLGMALDWADRQQEPLLLSLAPDAQARFFEWRNALDVQRLDLPPNFRGFLPKAYGYALRIAGALHALERFAVGREPSDTLTLAEMERAILAVHFFLGQAVDALRLLVGEGAATAPVEVSARTVLLAQVLEALRGQVDNGRLAVGFVQDAYNAKARPEERMSPHAMGALLRACGLTVSNGLHDANGRKRARCLVWDDRTCSFAKQNLGSLGSLETKQPRGLGERDFAYDEVSQVSRQSGACETTETLQNQSLAPGGRAVSTLRDNRDKRDFPAQKTSGGHTIELRPGETLVAPGVVDLEVDG